MEVQTANAILDTVIYAHKSMFSRKEFLEVLVYVSTNYRIDLIGNFLVCTLTSLNRGFGEGSVDQYCSFRKITVLM